MNTSYISIFLAVFVIITLSRNEQQQRIVKTSSKRRRNTEMDNSLLSAYIGKECVITANGYVTGFTGTVCDVKGNWISLTDKKGKLNTINCDYISSIKEK